MSQLLIGGINRPEYDADGNRVYQFFQIFDLETQVFAIKGFSDFRFKTVKSLIYKHLQFYSSITCIDS